MLICPFCQEEITPLADGTCSECGCYLLKEKHTDPEDFTEDEWTETDWGEDIQDVTIRLGGDSGLPNTQS